MLERPIATPNFCILVSRKIATFDRYSYSSTLNAIFKSAASMSIKGSRNGNATGIRRNFVTALK